VYLYKLVSMLPCFVCWSNLPTYTHAYLWTHACFTFDWKETFCFNHVRHTPSYPYH
jgi:hypothetical protein